MATVNINKSTNEYIEIGIIHQLKRLGGMKGCAIISKGAEQEAPDNLPCVVVNCESVSKYGDFPDEIRAKQALVSCTLYGDSEQTTQAKFENYACQLEARLFDISGMKSRFNPPTSGRDTRKVKAIHLHDVTDVQTEADTRGTVWSFTAGATLICHA